MFVDKDTVRRIAKLARVAVDEAHLAPMVKELDGIVAWVQQLGEVDVEGVPQMTGAALQGLKMRADKVTDGGNAAALMANAPESEEQFFVVPKVIE